MSCALLSSAVDALRVNREEPACTLASRPLQSFTAAEWLRGLRVLDRTGITLPLYGRMRETEERVSLPLPVLNALELRLRDNQRRMESMLETFGQAVDALQAARIPFLCLKGFSLFPEYYARLWQRHQVDFDFLIAPCDAARAQAVLEALGYGLMRTAGNRELRFRTPVRQHLGRDAYMYQLQQGSAIELHTSFWDPGSFNLPLCCTEDVFERAETHVVVGVGFPRLSQAHAFLYQMLHVFRHFLGSWARPLWLYEIASFVQRHRDRDELWREVRDLVAVDVHLIDAAALVLLTTNTLFGSAIPVQLADLCVRPDQAPIRLWVERYARGWVVTDMPGNKLNLMLHRHFIADRDEWRRYLRSRLLPVRGKAALCEGLDSCVVRSWRYKLANLRYRGQRAVHHVNTGVAFVFESIAWKAALSSRSGNMASGALTRRTS